MRALLAPALFLGLALADPATSQTPCGTQIDSVTVLFHPVWTPAGSPYCVQSNISVAGVQILPGTVVEFAGAFSITVQTVLTAAGTEADPIVFRARPGAPGWNGILLANLAATSVFRHCQFHDAVNSALRVTDSNPIVEDCLFSYNHTTGQGGALWASAGSQDLTIDRCLFVDNTSLGHGGAVRAQGVNGFAVRFTDCRFARNEANRGNRAGAGNFVGGALYVSGNAGFLRCEVLDNRCLSEGPRSGCGVTVTSRGGGIYIDGDGVVTFDSSVIAENEVRAGETGPCGNETVVSRGGGIYRAGIGTTTFTNTVLAGNVVTVSGSTRHAGGGGLYVEDGIVDMVNCTIARNNIDGVMRAGGTVSLDGSIAFFNNANGTQLAGTIAAAYSCIQGVPVYPGTGNLNSNPGFFGTGNDCSDLVIVAGSPCIDAGDPAADHDDGCVPPGLGSARNDVGANGGPANCGWMRSGGFRLAIGPRVVVPSANLNFHVGGGTPGKPALVALVGINGVPRIPENLGLIGFLCPTGDWSFGLSVPAVQATGATIEWEAFSLSASNQLVRSGPFSITL